MNALQPAASPRVVSPGWQVRPATLDDLPVLGALLPVTADLALPPPGPQPGEPGPEGVWLVAAPPGGPAQACLRLLPVIGRRPVRHWFHVGCVVHAAPALGLLHTQNTLLLGNDHTGACELADVAWVRHGSLGAQAALLRLLLRAALLWIARAPGHFGAELIAELPGPRDAAGQSPFWQGLGRHFYAADPVQVARRLGPAWRGHVAQLLPRQPVYLSFLSPTAQAALAQVAPQGRLLMEALADEGLRYGHHVTIDEGGPVFAARVDSLPTLLQARTGACPPAGAAAGEAALDGDWLCSAALGRAEAATVVLRAPGDAALADASVWRLPWDDAG